MTSNLKPILTLVLIASLVPEVLSGSSPLSHYLNPIVFFIMVAAYGLTLLVIREYSVRKNLNFMGIFILGLAYGIYNEGILSHTITQSSGLPIPTFDNYGYIAHMSIPWMLYISVWHALSSVLFPLCAVAYMYSENRTRPWLSDKVFFIVIGMVVFLGGTILFSSNNDAGETLARFTFIPIIGVLIGLATLFTTKKDGLSQSAIGTGPLFLGLSTLISFHIPLILLSHNKAPLIFFYVWFVVCLIFYLYYIRKRRWLTAHHLLLFLSGWYITVALGSAWGASSTPETSYEKLITTAIAIVTLTLLSFLLIRKRRNFL